jgi:eukaryotic-like serine/threonine-protein kinase
MALPAGTRLGSYEILSVLGAGGMGEVYRARDTKLNRDVAIKVLLPAVANDPDRLARFSREAQVLASLNHPNIAHIHGLEDADGIRALVMELVDGPTLADRIAQGAIPLDDALPIATQMAEALEAAHEQGIIHRDLKPANIKVREDGTVKILDFGLAKAMEPAGTSTANAMNSPTISMHATQAGIILGTAAYMSPEQARGKLVDRRADIWAFGVILFEMLTRQRAFEGEDISITLAAVLKDDLDWSALPADTPAHIRTLLRRCLRKDPQKRLPHIGMARIEIDEGRAIAANPAPVLTDADATLATSVAAKRATVLLVAGVVIGIGLTAGIGWALLRATPTKVQPVRFSIIPPATEPFNVQGFFRNLTITPDGRHVVYVAASGAGAQLMIRAIDQLEAVALGGIDAAGFPFVSPDGHWIGFFTGTGVAGGELKKVALTGGPPITICRYQGTARGASWGDDDTIVFATNDPTTGLMTVRAGGGEPNVLTKPDAAHGEQDHVLPSLLPGGRAVLFTIAAAGGIDNAQVAVLDLKTGQSKTLIRGGSDAQYVETGHLVYASAGTLRAVRFDPARLNVLTDPMPLGERVTMLSTGAADFRISQQGTLVYVVGGSSGPATVMRSLVWVSREGREEPIKAPPRAYLAPRLSPDGTRVALDIRDQEYDIWIWDLAGETLRRLTIDPVLDSYPVWTADGRRLVFASGRAGVQNLFSQPADNTGTVERLTASPNPQFPTSISPDGTRLIFFEITPKTGSDLQVLRLERSASSLMTGDVGRTLIEPLVQTPFTERNGELSPDGHWLAYDSNESGRFQIYVRPFPDVNSGHWQISANGGSSPLWARNGRELFYVDGAPAMTAVPVKTEPTFSFGNPTKLFDQPYSRYLAAPSGRSYDVSADGKRFLMIKNNAGDQASTSASIVVVLNWSEELKQRVPMR